MLFLDAAKSGLVRYFVFKGRASRSEYWWFVLFYFIISIAAMGVDVLLGEQILTLLVSLVFVIPGISIATRRLHDINKSGWFQLLYLIPIIGAIVMVYFLAKKGDAGENRFGFSENVNVIDIKAS